MTTEPSSDIPKLTAKEKISKKRQQLREYVAKFKVGGDKSTPLTSIWNSLVTLLEILPLLALRFIEYPIFVFKDHFLATFILFSTTLLLLFLRFAFFESAPIINRYFNDIFLGFNALFWELSPSIAEFKKATLIGKLKDIGIDVTWVAFDATIFSHERSIHTFLVETPPECASFDSAWIILQRMFQSFASEGVCETLRYLIPSPELYTALDSVAGWMSVDNPVTLSSECQSPPNIDVFCTILGTGFVFLQLVLPIYLGVLFLLIASDEVWEIVKATFILAFSAIELPLYIAEATVNLL